MASKTLVVKTGNQLFDDELAAAMNESWKMTPFDFVDRKGFETNVKDPSVSFIVSIVITTEKGQAYHYLALVNGGQKSIKHYGYDDMIAYCPINHFVDEPENSDCHFRVRNMIESMIGTLQIMQEKNISGGKLKIVDDLRRVYRSKSPQIKKRTLLFCQESIGKKITQSDIASAYPYKFEICSKEKLAKVIKDRDPNYYYYQPGITLNKSMFVFDPVNGEVMYFDYQIMGLAINKKNLEDLREAVDRR